MDKIANVVNAWWKIIIILFFVGMLWTQVQQNSGEIEQIKPVLNEVVKIDGRITSLEHAFSLEYTSTREFQKEMRQELKEIKSILMYIKTERGK